MTLWPGIKDWASDILTSLDMDTYVSQAQQYLYENQQAMGGFFTGVALGTHSDVTKAATTVLLRVAERIVFSTGKTVNNLANLVADITVPGAGGLDTGAEANSAWYEVYAIHKSSDGTSKLLLHRALDYFLDETYDSDDATVEIRKATGTRTAVGQGIKVDTTGYMDFIDVELIRVGAVSGTIQAEIRSDAAGLPSSTVLATSDKLDASKIATSAQWLRFVFRDNPASLTATTQYHIVLTGSWTASDAVYIGWRCDTSAATYANGSRTQLDAGTWNSTGTTAHDFSFKAYVRRNDTAVTMPTGYDGKCRIGWVYNNSSGNLVAFSARDREVIPRELLQYATGVAATIAILTDLRAFVPPVPISFRSASLLATGAQRSALVLPVPEGYYNSFERDSGGSIWYGNGLMGEIGPVHTEYQGVYVWQDVGTVEADVGSWSW